MNRERFAVVGAGGHAKVVVSTIEAAGGEVVAVLDDDRACWGATVLGHTVTGPISADAVPPGALVVLAIGSNQARASVAGRLHVAYGRAVHPSAIVHSTATIGEGAVVFAGVVIQADTRLGPHCIVNTAASIDHDGRIGAFAHVAPGAHLAGGVSVGDGALIGVGSSVIPGMTIGDWAVIGAGAAVVGDIPAGVTAVGCPARVVKE